jgi:hypothetical protein
MTNPAIEEYSDLSENVHHYNTHYLAMLTIWLAFMGGLVTVVFNSQFSFAPTHLRLLKSAGVILSAVFWLNGEIYLYRQHRFESRLAELEKKLGFRQYSALVEVRRHHWLARLRLGRWSWRLLHVCIIGFWMVTLITHSPPATMPAAGSPALRSNPAR